nr:uncharacterized protein LOC115843856 isoform X1 [Globicephala melas]XP_030696188.1 uncharacterized protein LOC115843856 isoform X1 [Globicephala melas]
MKLLHAQHPWENAQGQGTRRVPSCLVLESPYTPQPLVLAPRPWSSAYHTSGDCAVPRPLPEGICCPRSLWSGLFLSPGLSQVPRGGSLDQETSLWLTSHLGPRGSHKGLSWARSPEWGQSEVEKPAEAVAREGPGGSCTRAPTESLSGWGSPSPLHRAQSWSEGQAAPPHSLSSAGSSPGAPAWEMRVWVAVSGLLPDVCSAGHLPGTQKGEPPGFLTVGWGPVTGPGLIVSRRAECNLQAGCSLSDVRPFRDPASSSSDQPNPLKQLDLPRNEAVPPAGGALVMHLAQPSHFTEGETEAGEGRVVSQATQPLAGTAGTRSLRGALASFVLNHVASGKWICGSVSKAEQKSEWPDFGAREGS